MQRRAPGERFATFAHDNEKWLRRHTNAVSYNSKNRDLELGQASHTPTPSARSCAVLPATFSGLRNESDSLATPTAPTPFQSLAWSSPHNNKAGSPISLRAR